MDVDDSGGDYDDHHRCRSCNRGPGEQGDFRFEVDGDEAKLDRGMVLCDAPEAVDPDDVPPECEAVDPRSD